MTERHDLDLTARMLSESHDLLTEGAVPKSVFSKWGWTLPYRHLSGAEHKVIYTALKGKHEMASLSGVNTTHLYPLGTEDKAQKATGSVKLTAYCGVKSEARVGMLAWGADSAPAMCGTCLTPLLVIKA